VNFVGCDSFYRMNQKFFIGSLLFAILQAMSFPSCSEVPAMLMIILIFSFYLIRKDIAAVYRRYSFFVIYYLQFTLTLKFLYRVVSGIDFIDNYFKFHKDDSTMVAAF
jgi:hypothetical protein